MSGDIYFHEIKILIVKVQLEIWDYILQDVINTFRVV